MFRKLQSLSAEFVLQHRFGDPPEADRVSIADVSAARAWLAVFAGDPLNREVLRDVLREEHRSLDVSRLDDVEVLELLAPLVADRTIEIGLVPRRAVAAPSRGGDAEEPKPQAPVKRKELTWISIELVDDRKPPQPVPNAAYRIELPDGSMREGRLDAAGRARLEGIEPGTCTVSFPSFYPDDWKKL